MPCWGPPPHPRLRAEGSVEGVWVCAPSCSARASSTPPCLPQLSPPPGSPQRCPAPHLCWGEGQGSPAHVVVDSGRLKGCLVSAILAPTSSWGPRWTQERGPPESWCLGKPLRWARTLRRPPLVCASQRGLEGGRGGVTTPFWLPEGPLLCTQVFRAQEKGGVRRWKVRGTQCRWTDSW